MPVFASGLAVMISFHSDQTMIHYEAALWLAPGLSMRSEPAEFNAVIT